MSCRRRTVEVAQKQSPEGAPMQKRNQSRNSLPVSLMNTVSRLVSLTLTFMQIVACQADDFRQQARSAIGKHAQASTPLRPSDSRQLPQARARPSACAFCRSQLENFLRAHAVLQLARLVAYQDFAMINDGDALAKCVGFLHVVRGQDDR